MSTPENAIPATSSSFQILGVGRKFWLVAGVLLATLAWVVLWYFETAADVASIWWKSDTFAHGLVVLPIFAWLVWRKRETVQQLMPTPTIFPVAGVAFAGLAWLIGELISVASVSHVALAFIIVCAFVAVLGWRLSRVLLFALLFLFCGVPVGEFLLPVLMKHTADFTVLALRATGVPVYQEGLYFVVPNGRWSVVEACSGLRYLVASLMVGALYAYLNYSSLKRRLLFMVVALVVPIVANWIRAYITVMIGYHFGDEFVKGFIHIVYGWVFFGIVIFLMFMIGARWHEEPQERPKVVIAGSPGSGRGWWVAAVLALSIAVFPLFANRLNAPVEPFHVTIEAPPAAGNWHLAHPIGDDGFRPGFRGFRGELLQTYRRDDGQELVLYAAYYAEQRSGEELVMHGNELGGRPGSHFVRTDSADALLSIGKVRHAGLRRGAQTVQSWSWYWINGHVVTSDYLAKALLALDRLTGRKDDSAVVFIIKRGEASVADREIVEDFLTHHWPATKAQLLRLEERP